MSLMLANEEIDSGLCSDDDIEMFAAVPEEEEESDSTFLDTQRAVSSVVSSAMFNNSSHHLSSQNNNKQKCSGRKRRRRSGAGRNDIKISSKMSLSSPSLSSSSSRDNEVFACHLCQKEFSRRANRDRHVDTVHLHLRPFKCTHGGCGLAFGQKATLQRHHRRQHGSRKLENCRHCKEAVSKAKHSCNKKSNRSPSSVRSAATHLLKDEPRDLQKKQCDQEQQQHQPQQTQTLPYESGSAASSPVRCRQKTQRTRQHSTIVRPRKKFHSHNQPSLQQQISFPTTTTTTESKHACQPDSMMSFIPSQPSATEAFVDSFLSDGRTSAIKREPLSPCDEFGVPDISVTPREDSMFAQDWSFATANNAATSTNPACDSMDCSPWPSYAEVPLFADPQTSTAQPCPPTFGFQYSPCGPALTEALV